MVYVTTDATNQNRSAIEIQLRLALRRCRYCAPRTLPQEDGFYMHLFNFLCDIMRIGFEDVLFCGPHIEAPQSFGTLWPRRAEDVLPHGGQATFSAMLYWLKEGGQRIVNRLDFVDALSQLIDTARDGRLSDLQDGGQAIAHLPVDPSETLLVHVLGLMECIVSARPAELATEFNTRRLLRGANEKFIGSVMKAAAAWAGDDVELKLTRIAASTTFLMGTRYARLHSEVPAQLVTLDGSDITGACRLHRLLLSTFVSERCSSPHCGLTAQELRRRPQRCGSCMVFRYCSRECQKSHWSTHKKACWSIRDVVGGWRTPIEKVSIEAFGATCLRADFDTKRAMRLWSTLTS
ncbi:hypothetical protein AURDEDRAFT_163332 [Auricularia subglabra TFB-10046 SS5]|nr:hypothetical protein AURDEDRAFT_163332 [Auricularia subglabra TFB-10046 SS5]